MGPALAAGIDDHTIYIKHHGTVKNSDKNRIRIALEPMHAEEYDSSLENDRSLTPSVNEMDESTQNRKGSDEKLLDIYEIKHKVVPAVAELCLRSQENIENAGLKRKS